MIISFPVRRIFQQQSSNGRGLLDLWRAKRDATSPGAAKGSSTCGEARLVLSCCLVDTKPVLRSVELLFRSPTPSRYRIFGKEGSANQSRRNNRYLRTDIMILPSMNGSKAVTGGSRGVDAFCMKGA